MGGASVVVAGAAGWHSTTLKALHRTQHSKASHSQGLKPRLAYLLWWALLWCLWVLVWLSREVMLWWVLQSLSLVLQVAQYRAQECCIVSHLKRQHCTGLHPDVLPAVVGAAVVVVGACVVVAGGAAVLGASVVVAGAAGCTVPHSRLPPSATLRVPQSTELNLDFLPAVVGAAVVVVGTAVVGASVVVAGAVGCTVPHSESVTQHRTEV